MEDRQDGVVNAESEYDRYFATKSADSILLIKKTQSTRFCEVRLRV